MIRFILLACAGILVAAEGVVPSPALIDRRLTAWTTPIRTMDLAPEVAGRLVSVAVEPGERTPATGPVIVLDAELADLAVAQAEAALSQAKALVEERRQGLVSAQATLTARGADQARRSSERVQAGRDRERSEELWKKSLITEQERERAAQTADNALQAEQAAAADHAAAVAARGQAEAAIQSAVAQIAMAESQLSSTKAQRSRHAVTAPVGWIVVARLREPGAMVAAGTPVLHLADVSRLLLTLRLDEAELADLRRRTGAGTLSVRFADGKTSVATLRRIDVQYDVSSRKRLVELLLPGDAAPEASGGLAVEVLLSVPDPSGGLAVPSALVQWRIEQPWVRLADGSERPVGVLRRTAETVVIAPQSLPSDVRLAPFPTAP